MSEEIIVGQKIVNVRALTSKEMKREGWEEDAHGKPTALVLENGVILYPSRDEEGNGAGALFGHNPEDDSDFYVFPRKV